MRYKAFNAAELMVWAVWLGGLWIVALLVAPALFKWLPRPDAGMVAGRLFLMFGWANLIVPVMLTGMSYLSGFKPTRPMWIATVLMVMLAASSVFLLQPQMNELRVVMQDADEAALMALRDQFSLLHRGSSVLFAAQMLLGLWWGWRRFVWGVQKSST